MICERCGRHAVSHIMSMFNEQTICGVCKDIEYEHPLYETACAAERDAVMQGDYNFPGIGLPSDLEGGGHVSTPPGDA